MTFATPAGSGSGMAESRGIGIGIGIKFGMDMFALEVLFDLLLPSPPDFTRKNQIDTCHSDMKFT